ncbi:MAG: hypothetical protein E6Q88_14015 [Lysobacteraceae bacterium]|nr:MAG: hypothetical protein E6Q88_14015 [Xanthomonadaceae bacterium]
MPVPDDPILALCALHSLALALFHIAFWKLFRWPKTLQSTTLPNRAILQIANVQLIWLFLGVAILCWRYPAQLRETPLGHAVMFGMCGFWVVRLLQQFVFLRVSHPLVHGLSVVFALGAFLFALPLFQ